jgi:MFS family permease
MIPILQERLLLSLFNELIKMMRESSRNFKVLIARSSIARFNFSIQSYDSIYTIDLGASETQLGMTASATSIMTTLFSILTGWISDRSNRKTMILIGMFFQLLSPAIYFIAKSWTWVILATALMGIGNGFVIPAYISMYADSVSNEVRGTTYGIAMSIAMIPSLIAPPIIGAIVEHYGGLNVSGIKTVYPIRIGVIAIGIFLIYKFLIDKQKKMPLLRQAPIKSVINDYKEIVDMKGTKAWFFMKSFGALSIGMVSPLWMLYAATVGGASALTIAFMITSRRVANIMTSPFVGKLVDRIGRKKMIFTARSIMYIGTLFFLFFHEPWQLIGTWIVMGISDSAMVAWTVQTDEMVPMSYRSRFNALDQASFNLLSAPAAILGGFLWENVTPMMPFLLMILIDAGVRMPLIYFLVPEGKREGTINSE